MYILLSSASSPRYRDDILRCLAAPIGAQLQFRYDKRHISNDIQQDIENSKLDLPKEGLVCFLGTADNGILPVTPVRIVTVRRVVVHGGSISLTIEVGDMSYTDREESFIAEVDTLSGNSSPRRIAGKVEGKFFFKVHTKPGTLRTGRTISDWEKTASALSSKAPFQSEPFFWTVVGLEKLTDLWRTDTLQEWPKSAVMDDENLLIFHYAPHSEEKRGGALTVEAGPALMIGGPHTLPIDSRYDLKKWRLQPHSKAPRSRQTWLRIVTSGSWSLDLPLTVRPHIWASLIKAAIVGILIAAPTIVSVILQKDLSVETKYVVGIVACISGLAAAATAVFSVEKLN